METDQSGHIARPFGALSLDLLLHTQEYARLPNVGTVDISAAPDGSLVNYSRHETA